MPNNAVHGPFDREHHNIGSVTNPQINTPTKPNPAPGTYVVVLLRFTDSWASKCYGCRGTLKSGSANLIAPTIWSLYRSFFVGTSKMEENTHHPIYPWSTSMQTCPVYYCNAQAYLETCFMYHLI